MSDPCTRGGTTFYLVDGMEMFHISFHPFPGSSHSSIPPGTKFDHLGLLKKPFTMTKKAGYMIIKKNGKVNADDPTGAF